MLSAFVFITGIIQKDKMNDKRVVKDFNREVLSE